MIKQVNDEHMLDGENTITLDVVNGDFDVGTIVEFYSDG